MSIDVCGRITYNYFGLYDLDVHGIDRRHRCSLSPAVYGTTANWLEFRWNLSCASRATAGTASTAALLLWREIGMGRPPLMIRNDGGSRTASRGLSQPLTRSKWWRFCGVIEG